MKVKILKNSIIWNKSFALAKRICEITDEFPLHERYELVSQIRRCGVSVPSNIAEGLLRISRKELRQYLGIARGSLGELMTQLELAKELGYLTRMQA